MCNRIFRLIEILETLNEQGFIEFVNPTDEMKQILFYLWALEIVDEPREVSGSYGARLISEYRSYALLNLFKMFEV